MKFRSITNRPLSLLITIVVVLVCVFVVLSFTSAQAYPSIGVCYVKYDAPGNNNGSSWYDAYEGFIGVQSALSDANCTEIWVAKGFYWPTDDKSRTSTFQLKNGVSLYGGFNGTEISRNQRDIVTNKTILSGNINDLLSQTDNVYHVITGNGTNLTAILDGFTVSNGLADSSSFPNNMGGGMYTDSGSPTIRNVTFQNNTAKYGGGIGNNASGASFWGIVISSNTATAFGGGIYNYNSTNDEFGNVTIVSNNAGSDGGAIYNFNSDPTISHVTVYSNTTSGNGGGMTNNDSSPDVENSIFWGNTASSGVQIYEQGTGGGTIRYSVVEGGFPGGTNIITDDPVLGELRYYGGRMEAIPLLPGSSALETADGTSCPIVDQRGLSRTGHGTGCDIGAFEFNSTLYANPGGRTSGFCQSWSFACGLKFAMDISTNGQEVWVKGGTYKPTDTTNRSATFQLKSGVSVYGGFAGSETSRSLRDWELNITTLSGEIGTAATTDNSYHVVTGIGPDASGVLDGFTVSNGYANGTYPNYNGAGMYGSGTLVQVILSNNTAEHSGGGLAASVSDEVILENVVFENNTGSYSAGGFYCYWCTASLKNVTFKGNEATSQFGGGMEYKNANVSLMNVVFEDNHAGAGGGGLFEADNNSSAILTYVTFKDNEGENGGGMETRGSATLNNVSFHGNSATVDGGGLYTFSGSNPASPTLTNVTFYGNHANLEGGGLTNRGSSTTLIHATFQGNSSVSNGGAIYNWDESDLTVINSILWGNSSEIYNDPAGIITVQDSVIEGGFSGGTNIVTANPVLLSIGDHGGFTQTIPLGNNSSAIDTANDTYCPATDQRGVSRPISDHCDIGAYESGYWVFVPLVIR